MPPAERSKDVSSELLPLSEEAWAKKLWEIVKKIKKCLTAFRETIIMSLIWRGFHSSLQYICEMRRWRHSWTAIRVQRADVWCKSVGNCFWTHSGVAMLNVVGIAGSSRYRRHESVRNERPA